MRRTILAFLIAFLLLSLQQEAAVHAFAHLGDRHEQGATKPHEGQACAKCELLATSGDGVPVSALAADAHGASTPVAQVAFGTRAVAAPVFYSSRAPPLFS